jgi:hypothetical protein
MTSMPTIASKLTREGLSFGKMADLPLSELRAELAYWDELARQSCGSTQLAASRHAQRCLEVIRGRTHLEKEASK